jgi:hypothetical protein
MQIAEWMANELTEEMGMTRKLLAKIPHDKLNWQPAADLHTIGWNAAHLVEIISWVPGILTQAEWGHRSRGRRTVRHASSRKYATAPGAFRRQPTPGHGGFAWSSRYRDEPTLVAQNGRPNPVYDEQGRLPAEMGLQPLGSSSRRLGNLLATFRGASHLGLRRVTRRPRSQR